MATPSRAVEAKPPQARDPEKIAALMSRVEKTSNQKAREEREKLPAPPPPSPYVAGIDASQPADVAWHENHGILMPADPRVLSATGLDLVSVGKLERNLARNLPTLLQGVTRQMEIGGIGFIPMRLARTNPQLVQMVVEPDPARQAFIRHVWARNGIAEGPNLILTDVPEGLAALLADFRPDTVLVTDPDGPIAALHQAVALAGVRPKLYHHAVS